MKTEKTYELHGYKLQVVLMERIICIKSPKNLKKYLATDIDNRSLDLVTHIKQDYFLLMGNELAISDDSIIIEIWGHVYASHLAKAIKNLVQLQLVTDLSNFVIKRSDVIDCGERDIDSNRLFWDLLANFKGIILSFLPKQLK